MHILWTGLARPALLSGVAVAIEGRRQPDPPTLTPLVLIKASNSDFGCPHLKTLQINQPKKNAVSHNFLR